MTCGSNALRNGRSRDKKAKDDFELRNWFAVMKNKEEMQRETENGTQQGTLFSPEVVRKQKIDVIVTISGPDPPQYCRLEKGHSTGACVKPLYVQKSSGVIM